MWLSTVEKGVRWTGAGIALASLALVYLGLWRGSHKRKGRTVGRVPAAEGGFFSFYLPAAILFVSFMYVLWRPLRLTLSAPARLTALIVGVPLCFGGLGLMVWGRLALGEMYNVSSLLGAELYAGHRLVTTGPFAIVRHPMYLGVQLAALGALLIYRTWAALVMAITLPSIMLRARREEEALAAEFGEEWEKYRRRVPFWIPQIRS